MTVPTCTSEPSSTTILRSRPSEYASISTTVLSVSISANLSPRPTFSPSATNHLAIVPSVMSAPIEGIVTSLINFGLLQGRSTHKFRESDLLKYRVFKDPLMKGTQDSGKDEQNCRALDSLYLDQSRFSNCGFCRPAFALIRIFR